MKISFFKLLPVSVCPMYFHFFRIIIPLSKTEPQKKKCIFKLHSGIYPGLFLSIMSY